MKKILIFTLCSACMSGTAFASICKDFDDDMNLIEYECGTSLQDAIKAQKNKATKQKLAEEKAEQARIAAERAEQERKEAEKARKEAEKEAEKARKEAAKKAEQERKETEERTLREAERIKREREEAEEKARKEAERAERERKEAEKQARKDAERARKKAEEQARKDAERARQIASCTEGLCKYWINHNSQWFVGLGLGLFKTDMNDYTSWKSTPSLPGKDHYIGANEKDLVTPIKTLQFGQLYHFDNLFSNWSLLWKLNFSTFDLKTTYHPTINHPNYGSTEHTIKFSGIAFSADIGADYKFGKYIDVYGGVGVNYINLDTEKDLIANHTTNPSLNIHKYSKKSVSTIGPRVFIGIDITLYDWLRLYLEPSVTILPDDIKYIDAVVGTKIMF